MYSTEIKASRNIWIPFYLSEVCAYQCVRCCGLLTALTRIQPEKHEHRYDVMMQATPADKMEFCWITNVEWKRMYNIRWGLKTFWITSLATLAKISHSHSIFLSLFWIIYCKYWDFGFKCWSPFIKSLFNWDVTQSISPTSFTWIHRTNVELMFFPS